MLLNTALFVVLGLAAGVRTNIPFPLMAALCAVPAVGLVPWLVLKVGNRYGAILSAAVMLLAAKLAACVVARVVYGPDYIQAGYVAGDWRTAKLMISLFWGRRWRCRSLASWQGGSVLGSSENRMALWQEHWRASRQRHPWGEPLG